MKIIDISASVGKVQQITTSGAIVPIALDKAWNVDTIEGDSFFLEDQNGKHVPFMVIPLLAGEIKASLAGNKNEIYTIGAAEVTAYLGKPMPYMIERIWKTGTTVVKFNVGF